MREQNIDRSVHKVTNFENVDDFLSTGVVPAGILSIDSNGIPIDILNSPADSDTTIVSLHGAIDDLARLPMLVGLGVTRGLPASRIFISDPSLYMTEKLGLSWYAGSEVQPDLQTKLISLIEKIVDTTKSVNIVFFGSSGGGFAALALSRLCPGSLALPMNPQTSLARYYPTAVDRYMSSAWPGLGGGLSALPSFVVQDLVSVYGAGLVNTVAYIQNSRDVFHIENHALPFFRVIQSGSPIYFLIDSWGEGGGDGHVPAPKDKIQEILARIASCSGDWNVALSELGFVKAVDEGSFRNLVRKTVA